MKLSRCLLSAAALTFALLGAAACDGVKTERTEIQPDPDNLVDRYWSKDSEGLFGTDGILSNNTSKDNQGGVGIGVNSYLWRASLDTLSFMPLASADPFGGVIITDWYAPPETPDSRFKANVFILDRQLRADGVRVTLFQQKKDASGNWVDAEVSPKTATDLEDEILTRARQLRIGSTASR
jgi:hypothetical protein